MGKDFQHREVIQYNFIFFIFIFLLYNIVLVLPYINMHPPWVYTCSPSWTPPPTSLPVPSFWVIPVHQPQASCILHRTWTGDLLLIWYYTCLWIHYSIHKPLSWNRRSQTTEKRNNRAVLVYAIRKKVSITNNLQIKTVMYHFPSMKESSLLRHVWWPHKDTYLVTS